MARMVTESRGELSLARPWALHWIPLIAAVPATIGGALFVVGDALSNQRSGADIVSMTAGMTFPVLVLAFTARMIRYGRSGSLDPWWSVWLTRLAAAPYVVALLMMTLIGSLSRFEAEWDEALHPAAASIPFHEAAALFYGLALSVLVVGIIPTLGAWVRTVVGSWTRQRNPWASRVDARSTAVPAHTISW